MIFWFCGFAHESRRSGLHPKRHIRSRNPLFFLTNDFLIYILYIIYFYSRVYISSGRNLVFHPVFVYFQYWSPRSYLSRLPQVRILPPRISMRWRRRRGRRDGHFCSPRCIPTGSLLSIPPRFTACTFYRCIWYNYLWFIIMIYDYMIYEIFYILYILIIPCRSSAA